MIGKFARVLPSLEFLVDPQPVENRHLLVFFTIAKKVFSTILNEEWDRNEAHVIYLDVTKLRREVSDCPQIDPCIWILNHDCFRSETYDHRAAVLG